MYKRAGAKVTEIKGSYAVFFARPRAVADVLEQAACSTSKDTGNAGGPAAKRSKFQPATRCISPSRMTVARLSGHGGTSLTIVFCVALRFPAQPASAALS